jgi:hypothetical protein
MAHEPKGPLCFQQYLHVQQWPAALVSSHQLYRDLRK